MLNLRSRTAAVRRAPAAPAPSSSLGADAASQESACIQGIQLYLARQNLLPYAMATGMWNPQTEQLLMQQFGPDWKNTVGGACNVLATITLREQQSGGAGIPWYRQTLIPGTHQPVPFGMSTGTALLALAGAATAVFLIARSFGTKPGMAAGEPRRGSRARESFLYPDDIGGTVEISSGKYKGMKGKLKYIGAGPRGDKLSVQLDHPVHAVAGPVILDPMSVRRPDPVPLVEITRFDSGPEPVRVVYVPGYSPVYRTGRYVVEVPSTLYPGEWRAQGSSLDKEEAIEMARSLYSPPAWAQEAA